jgi:hypothetical protein
MTDNNWKIDGLNMICVEYVIYFVKCHNDDLDEGTEDDANNKIDIYNLTIDDFNNYILTEFTESTESDCDFMDYFNKRNIRVCIDISNDFIELILQTTIQNLNITNDEWIQEFKKKMYKLFRAYAYSYIKNLGLENLKLKIKSEIDYVHHIHSLGDDYHYY